MKWNNPTYKSYWRDLERKMTNAEKLAFNEWREDQRLMLEAFRIHAQRLQARLQDTPLGKRAEDLAKRAKTIEEHFTTQVPMMVRLYGKHAT